MNVEIDVDGVLSERVAEAWPGTALAGPTTRLTGGFWAAMYRARLVGQPSEVPAEVVVRIAPDRTMAAKETSVQRAVAEVGFPTPRVRLERTDDAAMGGTWCLMDFAAGTSPISGLDGAAALRRAPALFARLPGLLASPMAKLHALDTDAVSTAVARSAPDAAWSVDELLGHFEAGAVALDRTDLVELVRAVGDRRPAEGPTVVCHGDLHPFNVLVDDGRVTVVDWTAAIRAEPAYDVAFTALLLGNPPLDAQGVLGTIIGRLGRSLRRRFVSRYCELRGVAGLDSLDWYTGLHGLRILVEGASLGPGRNGHPFVALEPAARAAVAAVVPV